MVDRKNAIWEAVFPPFFLMMMLVASTMIFSIIGSAVVSLIGISAGLIETWNRVSNLLITMIAYVLTLVFMRRYFEYDEFRFGKDPGKADLKDSVIMILFAFAAAELAGTAIDLSGLSEVFHTYDDSARVMFQGQNVLLLILDTVILGPLTEEMIFRGMTFRRIRDHAGETKAIFLSALLFGVYHMNIVQGLFSFIVGCLLAWLYAESGTLLVPLAAHMLINFYAAVYNLKIDLLAENTGFVKAAAIVQLLIAAVTGILILLRKKRAKKLV